MNSQKKPVKLLALDLDGTLFDNHGIITPRTITAIQKAMDQGVHVIISTGRPFCGIPFSQLKDVDLQFAITTNGAAVYNISGVKKYEGIRCPKKLLFEECLSQKQVDEILPFLFSKEVHFDAFIEGDGYTPIERQKIAMELNVLPSLKDYILNTREKLENFQGYIIDHQMKIQKMTINFKEKADGSYVDRDATRSYLESRGDLEVVSGGYSNVEFTSKGVTKGNALRKLAEMLAIPMEETMAIGDTENDLSIIKAAAYGVAMGNAPEEIKAQADLVTASNTEDGVAQAIEQWIIA